MSCIDKFIIVIHFYKYKLQYFIVVFPLLHIYMSIMRHKLEIMGYSYFISTIFIVK